jgi:transcriptional regulator with PAS, ATPase and Fis domain
MRVIAASNVPLKKMVAEGKMRSDFYYRINVIPMYLVPLRQRRVDIPLLVHDFLHHHPVAASKRIKGISKQVMSILMDYAWPGNIRELHNVLERAIVLAPGPVIETVDLPDLAHEAQPEQSVEGTAPSASLEEWMREQEKRYLAQKLDAYGGNVTLTAKSCGIGVRTLSRKMRLHNLDPKFYKRSAATPELGRAKQISSSPIPPEIQNS